MKFAKFTASLLFFYFVIGPLNCLLMSQQVFEGKTFTERVTISGHNLDGVTFRNCTFRNIPNGALRIENTSNGIVEDCLFENMGNENSVIWLREDSQNWTIRNCTFRETDKNPILTGEGAVGLTVEHCNFINVAKRTTGSRQHAIYIQAPGYLVQYNRIKNVYYANGISVRSTGTVRGNIINRVGLSGSDASCIKYFPDHPAGPQKLLIENNLCWDPSSDGIRISHTGNPEFYSDSVVVRFNTIIKRNVSFLFETGNSGIAVFQGMENKYVEVYGNLILNFTNLFDNSTNPPNTDLSVDNLFFASNPGFFMDWANEDFHISNDTRIIDTAVNVPEIPQVDVDEEARPNGIADIGADEWYSPVSVYDAPETPEDFSVSQNYPNPFNPTTTLQYHISKPGDVIFQVFDTSGREVAYHAEVQQNSGTHEFVWNAIDSNGAALTSGVYFASLQTGSQSQTVKMILIR